MLGLYKGEIKYPGHSFTERPGHTKLLFYTARKNFTRNSREMA